MTATELMNAADAKGMGIRDTAKRLGITDEGLIQEAARLDREWMARINTRIDAINGVVKPETVDVVEPVVAVKQRRTSTGRKKPVRAKIYGHPVTAVLRWMGANDWSFDQAATAIDTIVGPRAIADGTIRAQLHAGRTGRRGPAADITRSQATQLKEATK